MNSDSLSLLSGSDDDERSNDVFFVAKADEPAPHIPPTRPADLQPPLLTIHSNHDSFLAGLYAAQDFFCAVDPDTCVSNGASLQDNISLPRAQLEAAINAAASLLSQMRQQNA